MICSMTQSQKCHFHLLDQWSEVVTCGQEDRISHKHDLFDHSVPQKCHFHLLDQWWEVVTYGQDGRISSEKDFFRSYRATKSQYFTPPLRLLIFVECAHALLFPPPPLIMDLRLRAPTQVQHARAALSSFHLFLSCQGYTVKNYRNNIYCKFTVIMYSVPLNEQDRKYHV